MVRASPRRFRFLRSMAEPRAQRHTRSIPEAVNFERIATIYRLTPSQVYAGGAYSLLVAYVMWGAMSSAVVLGWLAFRLILCAVRIRESRVFARDRDAMRRIGHWRTRYMVMMLFEAPSWSFIALIFVPHVTGDSATFLYSSVLIVAAVGLFSLVSHFPTAVAFVLEITMPLLVKQLLTITGDTKFVAGGLCVFAGMLVYEAWRSDARWVELARLRYESETVAQQGERARALAEESSRAKSAFLANMSHEIRTPLNGMMGLTELLLRSELSAEQRSYLELSMTSSEHLLKLVEQVLDMSKISAGGVTLDEAPYNPHALADEVLQTFAAQAARSGIALRCRVSPSVPLSVVGDAMRLRQVLTNLVGNAVKFTHTGHITLSMMPVGGPQHGDATVRLAVAVTDTGPGIPADKQAMVFQAFTQADASTTRDYGGTGLGLTISAALVARMAGELALESTVGVGSRFHFELTQGLELPNAANGQRPVCDLHQLSVLWVDADDESRAWHKTVLDAWNARADAVSHRNAMNEHSGEREDYRVVCINRPSDGVVEIEIAETVSHDRAAHVERRVERLATTSSFVALRTLLQRVADDVVAEDIVADDIVAENIDAQHRLPDTSKDELAPTASRRRFTPPLSRAVPGISLPMSPAIGAPTMIRVLLAEDNDINALIATRMLQQLGAEVTRAVTGAEALERIAEQPFDIVFMDVQMPVMDGYEATLALRARERQIAAIPGRGYSGRDPVPVIALTANVLPADRARCDAVGMTDYLAKPVVAADLAAMFARYAGGRSRGAVLTNRAAS